MFAADCADLAFLQMNYMYVGTTLCLICFLVAIVTSLLTPPPPPHQLGALTVQRDDYPALCAACCVCCGSAPPKPQPTKRFLEMLDLRTVGVGGGRDCAHDDVSTAEAAPAAAADDPVPAARPWGSVAAATQGASADDAALREPSLVRRAMNAYRAGKRRQSNFENLNVALSIVLVAVMLSLLSAYM